MIPIEWEPEIYVKSDISFILSIGIYYILQWCDKKYVMHNFDTTLS